MKKEKFLKECAKKGHDVEKCKEFIDRHGLYEVNMKILEDYAISSRKFGFTTIYISQNYTSVPKIISRNCNYIFCFKINDKTSIIVPQVFRLRRTFHRISYDDT